MRLGPNSDPFGKIELMTRHKFLFGLPRIFLMCPRSSCRFLCLNSQLLYFINNAFLIKHSSGWIPAIWEQHSSLSCLFIKSLCLLELVCPSITPCKCFTACLTQPTANIDPQAGQVGLFFWCHAIDNSLVS